MPARRHTLPRSRRLSGRLAFRRVFDEGAKATRGPITAYLLANGLNFSRLGLTVPRHVGTAVRRNRIKRLLREAFRHLQHDFAVGCDFVIVVRKHNPLPLAEYQRILSALLIRAHAQIATLRPEGRRPQAGE